MLFLIGVDFKADMNHYLGSLKSSNVRSLKELVDWNIAHTDIAVPEG